MRQGRFVATIGLSLATLAGCRTAPYVNSHLETVNSEYRQLEDYVYSLEDENARLTRELDDCKKLGAARGDAASPPARGGLFRRKLRSTPGSDSPELSPPTIDPGTPSEPSIPSETPPRRSTLNRPAADAPPEKLDLEPPTVELPAPGAAEPTPAKPGAPAKPEPLPPAAPTDTKVTHLFLNPIMTGGSDLDSRPGDDGLSVVIEPRNAADEYVPQAGAISIVVLDPSKAGEEARVARWNFDLSAMQQKLKTGSAARGIQLQMPWPATPPAAERLQLFVRYETADGRQLQTDREIFLTLPGQLSQRWTPRQRGRESLAETTPTIPQAAIPPKTEGPSPTPTVSTAPNLLAPPTWSPYR
jgi:hypothetical protein